ncbi:hypothetical protein RD792_011140 [Penstemon davidsonii]|uniref:BEACH domain-containing protein B n=1 Tax=Penstemon davidsonii TaxID=160366 RepID=A0ABR0D3S4_9LAMI|nr:hypothetical protein RD792_011140 [Penstemon davidsonii]
MLQAYKQSSDSVNDNLNRLKGNETNASEVCNSELSSPFPSNPSISKLWKDYVASLSAALCCFILEAKETKYISRNTILVSTVYAELSVKWFARVLFTVFSCIKACSDQNEMPSHLRMFACIIQHYVLVALKKVLVSSPSLVDVFRAEGVWDFIFSESFFYFGPAPADFSGENFSKIEVSLVNGKGYTGSSSFEDRATSNEVEIFQVEVISFIEFAATLSGSSHNLPECSVLVDALEQSACNPELAIVLAKSLLHILQISTEKTFSSFKTLDAIPRVLKIVCVQIQESKRPGSTSPYAGTANRGMPYSHNHEMTYSPEVTHSWSKCIKMFMELFAEYFSVSDDAKVSILRSSTCIICMFDLFWEECLRNDMLKYVLDLMKIVPFSEEDQKEKLFLCSKYLETFTHLKERVKNFADLSIELLVGMRDLLITNQKYYQALFREGECFLHVVSLLNGNLDAETGEKLVLNVIQTLTCLLSQNDASKAAFRALVGKDYQMLQSLLLDFCQWQPSEALLSALLDMLVDGKFDLKVSYVIKNEDVILLYLSVLRKCSDSMQHHGLNMFLYLLKDSLSNRASCVKAGMLNFLLNWFVQENSETMVREIAQLMQVIGGHSISGKDIRKIFALLRSENTGHQHSSLLLTSMLAMLNEKGPTAFFDLSGIDSGIRINTPIQWPFNKGFSFTCWLRVESFPQNGAMGLFSFLTENGRGCYAVITKDRAFSGGSQLKCYLDGVLVSSEKCRYPKINEQLTSCTIGTKLNVPVYEDEVKDSYPFRGQLGPTYLFGDAISSEQVHVICSLGPSYMYYFLDSESSFFLDYSLSGGILDAKDGLASKIIFGLNAQASNGRKLFNVSPILDHALDKKCFEATVLLGTQLCSRRLLQQIIYCVGGVSVFFPLLTLPDTRTHDETDPVGEMLLTPITKGHLTAETIKLIASILDDDLANQQQMLLLSGFSVLGFLLQSVPPKQLNLETLSALKHLFSVIANGGLSELLVKDAISYIFLNPQIWVHTVYKVQRELYMFLIQQLDNDPRLLKSLCRLPRVLDIIRKFYRDYAEGDPVVRNTPTIHVMTDQITREMPDREEIHKIRLLLLSLGEMSLREHITVSDIKALVAFFETCQDIACIEDILNMIIRAVSQKPLLASFLEQMNITGGCHIFFNLLTRNYEPVRLLGLQFIGRLLLGLPSEKKGSKFFNISVGRSKSLSEGHKKISLHMQTIFSIISDRLFTFPQTDHLCATLFDILLGGASPKQVLRKHNQFDRQKSSKHNSQFLLPQVLSLIFRFLTGCEDRTTRIKIMGDLLDLLDSNPSNIEALMEYGWSAWLVASVKLDLIKNYKVKMQICDDAELDEQYFVRNIYGLVLCHYMLSVKGGWQNLEETVNFLLIQSEQGGILYQSFLRDVYEDLIQKLISLSTEDNIFASQPCRDNTLYLLKLVDEMLISEMDHCLPGLELENCTDLNSALLEAIQGEPDENLSGTQKVQNQHDTKEDEKIADEWWNIYDNIWIIISEMNGKGPSKSLPRSSSFMVPSLSQRARGLVESLNIPAAEMAAAVSGGISSALVGKQNKTVDKAMILRGERCSRIVYHLMILYLCRSSLGRASRCVQQVIPVMPFLLNTDDEQNKSKLQLFIWALLVVRSKYGILDDGARFHVISSLVRETINCGKSMLATSIMDSNDLSDIGSISKEGNSIFNFIQKDRLLGAVVDEVKYVKSVRTDRIWQLDELRSRLQENMIVDSEQKKAFEDQIRSSLNTIIASDDSRRSLFQLSFDEEQQTIAVNLLISSLDSYLCHALSRILVCHYHRVYILSLVLRQEKWIHTFRLLIDERGPWSANPFPNSTITHWKLDKTEDVWRRRQKLRRNYHFNDKLCHPIISTDGALHSTSDSKFSYGSLTSEKMKQFSLKGIRGIMDEGPSELSENEADSISQNISDKEDPSDRQYPEAPRESSEQDTVQDRRYYPSPTEPGNSEVLMDVPCVLVTPKRKLAGRLAILKKSLHFFGEFLVEGTGGSSVLKAYYSSGNNDPSNPEQLGASEKQKFLKWPVHLRLDSERQNISETINSVHGNNGKRYKSIKRHRWWNICKIKAVHWTRYLLRYTAIEIFFINSVAPIFLNFATQKDAKDVGNLIVATRNESIFIKGHRDKTGVISFVDRRVAQEMAETARESWRRREITNFEYLMILNTLAGRSYNDLTQYPVFPWILADYSSKSLDFKKSSTFRDLSKPVGALDPKRFEVFEDRYLNFSDPDIPSFYYGSHYSSMGIVLFYLLRLEPFTALHRSLQGSPEEFISKNREALESEYVSSNLHHWIDLVFGYKQRGKPAIEAANIFYYLTYEGAVNLDNMEDELQRSAIEDQIANFGQTPIQIFRKKHPRRGPPIPIAHPLRFAPGSINLTSVVTSTTISSSAVLYVNVFDSYIVLVSQNQTMSVKMWLTTQLQSGGNFTFSGSQDPFFGIGSDVIYPCKIGSPLADNIELGAQCFATMQTMSENYLISCGNWENSFQVMSLSDGRMVQSVRHHKDIVSCVAVTADGSTIASGSYDTTVMVWEILRVRAPEKRSRNTHTEIPWKDYVIADTPCHILCGHDDIVTCLHASAELDLVISGSRDGTCVFHTLREGRYVRSLRHPRGSPLSKLVASRHGRVVLYGDDDLSLHLYSINGRHISTAESNGRVSCLELSSCGEFLVCAGDQGQIVVRSMNSLEILARYTGSGKLITSLTVTPEECFIAGTKDGSLLVYSIENPQLHRTSIQRNTKLKASVT